MVVWCKRSFELHFSTEQCRLFSTQQQLFHFIDNLRVHYGSSRWMPFSMELQSEEDTSYALSRPQPHEGSSPPSSWRVEEGQYASQRPLECPCPSPPHTAVAGVKRRRLREDYALLYGADPLSRQTRYFLACTMEGLRAILARIPPLSLHLYEIIREGRPCHLYFDVECEGNVNVAKECCSVDDDEEDEQDEEEEEIEDGDVVVVETRNTANVSSFNSNNNTNKGVRRVEDTTLLVIPSSLVANISELRSPHTFTTESYNKKLAHVPLSSYPDGCCPLSCPCRVPNHVHTTDLLLSELYTFTKERYPHLLDGAPGALMNGESEDGTAGDSNSSGSLPAYYQCWKQVLVMRSEERMEPGTRSSFTTGKPKKFSRHYVIQMYGKVWESNYSVGLFVKEFVQYLSEKVSPAAIGLIRTEHQDPASEAVPSHSLNREGKTSHDDLSSSATDSKNYVDPSPNASALLIHTALFFHNSVKMWSVLPSSFVPARELSTSQQEGSALPFLTRKCVVDTAVYSRNRMMRCLGSCKLGKKAVLEMEMKVRERKWYTADPNSSSSSSTAVVPPAGSTSLGTVVGGSLSLAHSRFSSALQSSFPTADEGSEMEEDSLDVAVLRSLGLLLQSLITAYDAESEESSQPKSEVVSLREENEEANTSEDPCVSSYRSDVLRRPHGSEREGIIRGGNPLIRQVDGNPSSCPTPVKVPSRLLQEIESGYKKLSGRNCYLTTSPRQMGHCLLYTVHGSKYCQNVRREHKSNSVYVVVDTVRQWWFQKCFDPDCSHFRGPRIPFSMET